MTWLSQAELRRDTPQARQLAAQLLTGARWDSGHGLVWTLFAGDPEAERDFLYREAETGRYLVVSARAPAAEPAIWCVRSRPYAPALAVGDRYGFSLRANPVVALSRPGRARSHRADVMMEAKRRKGGLPLTPQEREQAALDWLFVRAERLGVAFDSEHCATRRSAQLKLARPGARPAAVTVVDYEGVLTVTAPDRLAAALTRGVGHGKAFGLGLLLLRRLDG